MALAIDSSAPAIATQTNGATATVACASFTPPDNCLLEIRWVGNTAAGASPSTPTITDNLGTHLTYTLQEFSARADSPNADGQCAVWTAPVTTGAAMTITVTNQASSGNRHAAIRVIPWTGQHATTPVGAHGKGGSTSASTANPSFTAQATGSWASSAVSDWDVTGTMTAGTGCTLEGTGSPGSAVTYGFCRRTTADGVNGNSNAVNLNVGGTSTNLRWVYIEILPAAGGSTSANAENAAGTGTAETPLASLSGFAESTAGTGTAPDPLALAGGQAGAAVGSGIANDPTTTIVANSEVATGTGTAETPLALAGGQAGSAAGTGAANDATVTASGSGAAEVAAGTGAADNALAALAGQAEVPTGTGTAETPLASVFAFAECAIGTGAANDATVNSGSNTQGPAECATGTGTAYDPLATLFSQVEVAAATATAETPISNVGGQSGVAAGTGAGLDALTLIGGMAESAAGMGAADDVLAMVGAPAGVATGSGTGETPVASVGGQAGSADAAGAAADPTTVGSSNTYGPAECAVGVGVAWPPSYEGERVGVYAISAREAGQFTGGRAAAYTVGGGSSGQVVGGEP